MISTSREANNPFHLAKYIEQHASLALASLIACLVLALTLHNQPYYPSTWLDEGFTLQGALNITRFGRYAMLSSEGFRVLDQPLIANGPGVVLPIAAAFLVFGTGLLQARVVVAVFAAATAVLFFLVAQRLFGLVAALLACVFLIGYPAEGFLLYGRQALGLVPSIGYFLAGCLAWLTALDRRNRAGFVLSGILFGLASITKGEYLLILPVLLVVALLDRLYWRQLGLRAVGCATLGMVGVLVAWYVAQLMLIGWESFGQHLATVSSSARVTVFAFRPRRIPGSLWYLIRTGSVFLILPALAYVAWSFRTDPIQSARHSLFSAFVLVWFCWYAIVSVGWHRYAVDPIAIGSIFTGKLMADLGAYADRALHRRNLTDYRGWAAGLCVALVLLVPCSGLVQEIAQIEARSEPIAQEFASYLQEHIPAGAVIESWEWEIDALTRLTFHHPTNDVVDRATARIQFGDSSADWTYWPADYDPSFLIDGPFSKWTGLYKTYLATDCCTPVASFGPYDLFRVLQK